MQVIAAGRPPQDAGVMQIALVTMTVASIHVASAVHVQWALVILVLDTVVLRHQEGVHATSGANLMGIAVLMYAVHVPELKDAGHNLPILKKIVNLSLLCVMTFDPVSYTRQYGIDAALRNRRHEMEVLLYDDRLFWNPIISAQKSYEKMKAREISSIIRLFERDNPRNNESYPSDFAIDKLKRYLNFYPEKNKIRNGMLSDSLS